MPQRRGLLEDNLPEAKVSSRTLRIMVVEFLPNYAHRIEVTADTILSQTDDPRLIKNALLWKINGISAGFGAASRPDALAAFLDMWVLVHQSRQLFETSLAPPQFGPWQGQAIAACRLLENQLAAIHDKLEVDDTLGATFVAETVRKQPLNDLYFQRAPLMTQNFERIQERDRELLEVISSLQQDVDEIQRVSALYAEFLPKQSRWQAELLAMDAARFPIIQASMTQIRGATQAANQIATTASRLESTLESELAAIPATLDLQREAVMQHLDQMRVETLERLTEERRQVMNSIHEEQELVSKMVQTTASQVTSKADQIVQRGIQSSQVTGEQWIDRAAIYLSALLGVASLIGLMLVWLVRAQAKRQQLADHPMPEPLISSFPSKHPEPKASLTQVRRRRAA